VEWVVREGVGAGGRNKPSLVSLYAHMNNKRKMEKKKKKEKLYKDIRTNHTSR
jgi:hypothetical protein